MNFLSAIARRTWGYAWSVMIIGVWFLPATVGAHYSAAAAIEINRLMQSGDLVRPRIWREPGLSRGLQSAREKGVAATLLQRVNELGAQASVMGAVLNDIDPRRAPDHQSHRYLAESERYIVSTSGGRS